MSDDWLILKLANDGSSWKPEANHFSLPMGLLWWVGGHFDSPIPARAVALTCHLISTLVVLPRSVQLLFPDWSARAGLLIGLCVLCLSGSAEPLVWACAAGYTVLGLCVNIAIYAHLRWLKAAELSWRLTSVVAVAAGLLTWEMGVCVPLLIVLVSVFKRRRAIESVRDALPHLLLLVPYAALKFSLDSVVTLAPSGPVRIVGNLVFTPLLALSPWLFDRTTLVAWYGAAMAGGLVVCFLGLGFKGRRREPFVLAAMGFAMLSPVLHGPGPEQRYLYLAAPWLLLATAAAGHGIGFNPRKSFTATLIVVWCSLSTANLWRWAGGWRESDRVRVAIIEGIVAAVPPSAEVAVIDAPDRLPGWGPTHKYWIFRFGLKEALAREGVVLRARGHWMPPNEEVLGRRLHTQPMTPDLVTSWEEQGWQIIDCRPAPLERVALMAPSGD